MQKRAATLALCWALALALIGPPRLAQAAEAGPQLPSFADLAERVSPAVVNIRIVKTVKGRPMMGLFGRERGQGAPSPEELFERFFRGPGGGGDQPREFKERSLGSGVIIDPEGYVLTNNHVIDGADEIVVRLKGEKELPAKIIGRDAKTDLALIKIDGEKNLPVLPLGDSGELRVGDWVLAVGNPFGLEHTVTAGIISAKGRDIGAGPYDDFLQTDASINPGNSGGPLIDLGGAVVGINTAIAAQGQGIGFAIPVNLAKKIVGQLREKGRVVRGYLGVYFQPVTPELAQQFGLKKAGGALVAEVIAGGPAAAGGVKPGDVIVRFDGREVNDWHELPAMVADTPVGREVVMTVIRRGGEKKLEITVGELKDGEVQAQGEPQRQSEDKLGLSLQELTPDLAQQLGVSAGKGLVVTGAREGGPAAEAGLRKGDVIVEADRKAVETIKEFQGLVRGLKPGDGLLVLYQREGRSLYTVIKAPKE